MARLDRLLNLFAVFAPVIAVFALIPVAASHDLFLWTDAIVFAVMYILCGFGITVGYHRLLTHRSFQTYKPVEYTFAILGSLAIQGGPLDWVAAHRKHHAHTDVEGDPHSPHVGYRKGVIGAVRGLWHAHIAWTWGEGGFATHERYAGELLEDKGMRAIHRWFPLFVLASAGIPFGLGVALTGTIHGGLTALFWGGLVRLLAQSHVTWSVNSVCHFFGRRRFDVEDHSTNVWWLALPSLGEAWHHNHHAFPRSHRHGLSRWEFDPSAILIAALKRMHLAWEVIEITPERQTQRLAAGT